VSSSNETLHVAAPHIAEPPSSHRLGYLLEGGFEVLPGTPAIAPSPLVERYAFTRGLDELISHFVESRTGRRCRQLALP